MLLPSSWRRDALETRIYKLECSRIMGSRKEVKSKNKKRRDAVTLEVV